MGLSVESLNASRLLHHFSLEAPSVLDLLQYGAFRKRSFPFGFG